MKYICLISLIISILSCTTRKKELLEDQEYQITHYKNDSLKHGKQKIYFKNGTLQRKMKWKNNLLHGKMTYYHSNGKIAGFYYSKNDTLNGPFKFFYPNGKAKFTLIYKHNNPLEAINCYSPKKEILDCGTLKNGDGYVLQYDNYGNFLSKDYYLHSNYIKSDTIL